MKRQIRDLEKMAEEAKRLIELEKQKAEAEKQRAEAEKQKAEAEKQRAEVEKHRVVAEKLKALKAEEDHKKAIYELSKMLAPAQIATALKLPLEVVEKIIAEQAGNKTT